ncbi:MAG: anhydro-N-acetylmuramic acid kinase [Candidatus Dadabacteria bacterium]|nr:MAG: anhydro-N-acetylmuramic acid kinase [Candidatus Dadabacteria bacterium]
MDSWLSKLNTIAAKDTRLVAGLISGTSADSVDAAICSIKGAGIGHARVTLKAACSVNYPDKVRNMLQESLEHLSLQNIAELDFMVARAFGDALRQVAEKASIKVSDLDLIGSHGQTIYHHSRRDGALQTTFQIGDGDIIAKESGVFVFSDFRKGDIALGGEGAPLSAYADAVLFGGVSGRAVLNLGGIANITVLSEQPEHIIGFDSGPANAPLDRLARIITGGEMSFDRDAEIAKKGSVNDKTLQELFIEDTFIKRPPPKSTGFESYGDLFVERAIEIHGKADADLMRTLVEFSAAAIGDALTTHISKKVKLKELILAGGGVHNPVLVAAIKERLKGVTVKVSDELGVPADFREAVAFAVLANDTLMGHETSLPSVTGASRGALLGKLSLPG